MSAHETTRLDDFEKLRERVRKEDDRQLEQLIICEQSFLASAEKEVQSVSDDNPEKRERIKLKDLLKRRLEIMQDERKRRNPGK